VKVHTNVDKKAARNAKDCKDCKGCKDCQERQEPHPEAFLHKQLDITLQKTV
jgi:hypothetical protein